jgi:type I restriction enzyme S subunit
MNSEGLLQARGLPEHIRWRLCRIGDLVELRYGKALPEPTRRMGSIRVYGSNGQCGWHDVALASGPTVVLGRKGQGPLGVEWCDEDFWVIDTAYYAKLISSELLLKFFYYATKFVGLNHLKDGTSNPSLGRDTFCRQAFPVPPLKDQRQIVSVLSAYDDLIENNIKRVSILQRQTDLVFAHFEAEAGQSVLFRKLGDIADEANGEIRTGPFGSQLHESDYTPEGTPVVMPKNLVGGRIDTSDIARIPDDIVRRLAQHKLSEGDTVYGRRGDIGRRAFIRKQQAGWLCGTGCLRLSVQGGALHPRYFYQYLGKPEIVSFIAGRAIGATMPNLNTSILRDVPIAVPSAALQEAFTRIADANDELIENLVEKNAALRRTRDLLLPRLLSGEIDVSTLPEPAA